MDDSERKRRIRRTAFMLVALVAAIYGAFIAYALTRH
jgi:uncharacterized membrane protein YsdA (DUF1294 family)